MRHAATALLAVSALALPALAAAQPYQESTGTLTVSETTIAPGEDVTVSGNGFAPSSDVDVTIESTPRHLASDRADQSGSFSATVEIPQDMSEGEHTLIASGSAPDGATHLLSAQVLISDESLPRTGANVALVVAAGVVVAAFGFLLVRGRRSDSTS